MATQWALLSDNTVIALYPNNPTDSFRPVVKKIVTETVTVTNEDGTTQDMQEDTVVETLGDLPPEIILVDVSSVESITVGWQRNVQGYFHPFTIPVNELIAYVNQKQWALAIGGYTTKVSGVTVTFDTSESGIALMTAKTVRSLIPNPPDKVLWQTGPMAASVLKMSDFVIAAAQCADFVQATFDILPDIFGQIEGGKIATIDDVDKYAWPSNVDASAAPAQKA